MKIALVFGQPPTAAHDAFLIEAHRLADKGISVELIAMRNPENLTNEFQVILHSVLSVRDRARMLLDALAAFAHQPRRTLRLVRASLSGLLLPKVLLVSLAFTRRGNLSTVDLLLVHFCEAQAQAAAVIAYYFNKHLIVHTHHSDIVTRDATSPDVFSLRLADALISVDNTSQNHVCLFPKDLVPPHLVTIPAAADVEIFASDRSMQDAQRLLFVGRLVPLKRIPDLLQAVKQVMDAGLCLHLDIVGDGPERSLLESLSANLGIVRNVTFHGSRVGRELIELYKRASIFVLPSQMEGTPRVLMEASAAGLATVATRVGGIKAMLPNSAVALFDPGDVTQLAKILKTLLMNPQRVREMGEAGRLYSENFTVSRRIDRLEKLFKKVLSGTPRGNSRL